MATTTLTAENFGDTLTSNEIVLVDFWASWCPPCRMFAPIYDEASDNHDDIVFGSVNTEEQQQLSAEFGISSIPTLMAFRDNILLFQQAGALSAGSLDNLIEQLRALDMDEIRAKIVEQRQANSAK